MEALKDKVELYKTTKSEVMTVMGGLFEKSGCKRDGSSDIVLKMPLSLKGAGLVTVMAVAFCLLLAIPDFALAACVKATPTITIRTAEGGTAATLVVENSYYDFTVTMTNNDSAECAPQKFTLTASNTDRPNWNAPTLFGSGFSNPPTLAPGATITFSVRARALMDVKYAINYTKIEAVRYGTTTPKYYSNSVSTQIIVPYCTPNLQLAPSTIINEKYASRAYLQLYLTYPYTPQCVSTNLYVTCTNSDISDPLKFNVIPRNTYFNAIKPVPPETITRGQMDIYVDAKAPYTSGETVVQCTAKSLNGKIVGVSNTALVRLSVTPCVFNPPKIIIEPASKTVAAGEDAVYNVSVQDTDVSSCRGTTFDLAVSSDSNTTDFDPSFTSVSGWTTMSPKGIKTATLRVRPKVGAPEGSYNDATIVVTGANHSPEYKTIRTAVGTISALTHNSKNLNSTKWASSGGWGIAGGKYGMFVCSTCHTTETTNIRGIKETIVSPNSPTDTLPGSSVAFTNTTSFGDDTGGHATSTKICEVCHTYDATGANGVKKHAYNMASDPGHNNGVDCTTCHKHSAGFSAAGGCTNCHGNAPLSVGELASDPFTTGSTTAGAHEKHTVTLSFACETCHTYAAGSVMNQESTVKPGYGDISIGFKYFSDGWTTGSYGGQSNVSYNQQLGDGTKSCSTNYCHGSTMGGTNPVWDSTVACGNCHNATAANPPALGSHQKHAGNGSGQLNLACTDCHGANGSGGNGHVTGTIQYTLNTGNARFGSGAQYNGASTGTINNLAPSASYASCSNVYCHSTGQSLTDSNVATPSSYSTPTWGGTVVCGSCHAAAKAAVIAANSGSHASHLNASEVSGCSVCHTDANDAGTAYTSSAHVDGSINVAAGNTYSLGAAGSPGDGYGTCSTASCHGDAYSAGTVITPVWGTSVSACAACHAAVPATGSHNQHIAKAAVCGDCHNGATAGTSGGAAHLDGDIDVTQNYPVNVTKHTAGSGYASCSTVACHDPGRGAVAVTPTWGGSSTCASCHDVDPATGSHTTHLSANNDCGNCHTGAVRNSAGGAGHTDGNIDVANGYPVNKTKNTAFATCS
ncbi:MAG: CxxxxCH/CxxCH domain-containing protein, partial [Nitrospirae bacterium]|nr:CxxxxCH/CxxCH domain-containing protein [Nitrospirota bacterium]